MIACAAAPLLLRAGPATARGTRPSAGLPQRLQQRRRLFRASAAADDDEQAGLRVAAGVELPSQGQVRAPALRARQGGHNDVHAPMQRVRQSPRAAEQPPSPPSPPSPLPPPPLGRPAGRRGGRRPRLHQPAVDGDPGAQDGLSGGERVAAQALALACLREAAARVLLPLTPAARRLCRRSFWRSRTSCRARLGSSARATWASCTSS